MHQPVSIFKLVSPFFTTHIKIILISNHGKECYKKYTKWKDENDKKLHIVTDIKEKIEFNACRQRKLMRAFSRS